MTENLPKGNASCSQCALQKICFPKGLYRADIQLLEEIVDRKPSLAKGEMLFRAGDPFSAVFAVKAGLIKVYTESEADGEVIHGFYLPGDVVGVDALAHNRYLFNAIALDVSNVCSIDLTQMHSLTSKVPNLNMHLLNIMSNEIVEGRLHSELLSKKSAEQRVANFLWSMVVRFRDRGYHYKEFRLNILHKEMASYLNLTPETVSRVLTKLSKQGVMTWKKKEVEVFDMELLQSLANSPC